MSRPKHFALLDGKWGWKLVGFLFVFALMAYYAFVTRKCLAYPWWYGLGSDGDGIYVTQTLALLNNGDLVFMMHPGVTVFSLHGLIYRILALLFPSCHLFLHLDQVSGPTAAFDLLDLAMHISRLIMVLLNGVCLAVFWRLLYQLTNANVLSFLLASFLMLVSFMLNERVFIIRPELMSFIFLILTFSLILTLRHRPARSLAAAGGALLVGFLSGMAVYTKLQVLPDLGVVLLFWLLSKPPGEFDADIRRWAATAISVSIVNVLVFPWSWLNRPALLTPEYLKSIAPQADMVRIYGSVPLTVAPVILSLFAVIVAVTVLVSFTKVLRPLVPPIYRMNLLVLGLILATYAVLLPLGMSHAQYSANSNHLLYSMVTSLVNGGNLNHVNIDADILKQIFVLHENSRILNVEVLWIVVFAAAAAMLRLFIQPPVDRRPYVAIMVCFALGFAMDLLSSFRKYTPDGPIVSSYAIYSLPVHVCGLAIWLTQECRLWAQRFKWNLYPAVCALLALHLLLMAHDIWRSPKSNGDPSNQTPQQEMLNTLSQVRSFWDIVSRGQLQYYK